jgi:hypothetical protein
MAMKWNSRLTRDEIRLLVFILAALVVGACVRQWRSDHRPLPSAADSDLAKEITPIPQPRTPAKARGDSSKR